MAPLGRRTAHTTLQVSTCDGHTYERKAIERWLRAHQTSPLTGAPLESTAVIPNIALRKLIQEYAAGLGNS